MPDLRVLAWPAFDNKTGNPYNRLLYSAMEEIDAGSSSVTVDEFTPLRALRGRYDIIHVHWPDDFLSLASTLRSAAYVGGELAVLSTARATGSKIVWTGHDLGPHESHHPALERLFWRAFPPIVDGFISLSREGLDAAERLIPALEGIPRSVVPHGHYRDAYPEPADPAEARAALGLHCDTPVLLFIGRIRPYKNVPHLVRTFRQWSDSDARLLVVGNPSDDTVGNAIRMAAQHDSRVRLDLRFVPDDVVPRYLAACNLVVLPYDHILHSGSALLGLSFNRPVLVPARGAMSELRESVGADWVRTYNDTLTPKRLRQAVHGAMQAGRPSTAPLENLEWSVLAEKTVDLYRQVLST